MIKIFKLCHEYKKLCQSHILPKSFTRRIRNSEPQLALVKTTNPPKASKSNGDDKEFLLCEDCELFLKQNYEDYGTTYLSNRNKRITNNKKSIIITGFEYEKYYLFLISILWRAAISSLPIYRPANAILEIEECLRYCIKEKTIHLSSKGPRIDEALRIYIFKIIDSENKIPQEYIDGVILSLNYECSDSLEKGIQYYTLLDGFLIIFSLAQFHSFSKNNWKNEGRIRKRNFLKAPKICFRNVNIIANSLKSLSLSKNPFEK